MLWGDAYLVNSAQDFAQGFEAVSIVADPDRFADTNIRSYYQVTADERDDRVPISSKLRTRTLAGGAFTAGTQLLQWVNRAPLLAPFVCGVDSGSCPQTDKLRMQYDFFGEDIDLIATVVNSPPAFVSRIDINDLAPNASFGFVDLNSTASVPIGGGAFEQRQAWLLQTSSAEGRFSVGLSSTRLDDLCKVGAQGE